MEQEPKIQGQEPKPRTRGKDKQPRKKDGYAVSSPANLVKARENSPIMQGQKAEMPDGYNTRRIAFMQAILPSEPLDLNDVAEMERRFIRYVNLCAEWDMKIGNQAAYAAIGITKDNVYDWLNRSTGNPARAEFIKKVQQFCAMYREGLMEDGKVNPVTGIFWQKNYDGMRDQQEVVLTPNNPLGEAQNAEQLKQKYLESAGIVEDVPELPSAESAEGVESPTAEP